MAKTAETSLDREKRWRKESGSLNVLSMVCVFQVFQCLIDKRNVKMSIPTLSSKFKISIRKDIREAMHLKPGQQISLPLNVLIFATALEHGLELVTFDAHFKNLPRVDYTPKST